MWLKRQNDQIMISVVVLKIQYQSGSTFISVRQFVSGSIIVKVQLTLVLNLEGIHTLIVRRDMVFFHKSCSSMIKHSVVYKRIA